MIGLGMCYEGKYMKQSYTKDQAKGREGGGDVRAYPCKCGFWHISKKGTY